MGPQKQLNLISRVRRFGSIRPMFDGRTLERLLFPTPKYVMDEMLHRGGGILPDKLFHKKSNSCNMGMLPIVSGMIP